MSRIDSQSEARLLEALNWMISKIPVRVELAPQGSGDQHHTPESFQHLRKILPFKN